MRGYMARSKVGRQATYLSRKNTVERKAVVTFARTAASAERSAAFALYGALEQCETRTRAGGRRTVAAADHARADEGIARDLGSMQGEAR